MIDYFDEIELIIYFKNTSEKTEKEINKKLKNVLKEFPGLTFYTVAKKIIWSKRSHEKNTQ